MKKNLFPGFAALFVIGVPILAALFVWYGCRIEPGNGQIAILIKKTGKTLPADEIVATSADYKGIQLEVLGEGRYFRNPYVWDWRIVPVTDIPAGKFGVLVRKFGKNLPEGEIIAPDPETRGIVREVLGTGKHRINPYAYDVKICDDIVIMPGNIGVVGNLTGKDLFSGAANDLASGKGFLTAPDRKGIQQAVLKEGTHRINPYIQSVAIVNIQSQRYEFSGKDAIGFITLDGFQISLEGTVEFNISADSAPCLTQEVGNMASASSTNGKVRAQLLELQRKLARENDVVMDGRDIGTNILPNAECKIYLTASSRVRAERRYLELKEKGTDCDLDTIEKEIIERDERDMNREIAPLKQAEDAVFLDTSDMSIDEVKDKIISIIDSSKK